MEEKLTYVKDRQAVICVIGLISFFSRLELGPSFVPDIKRARFVEIYVKKHKINYHSTQTDIKN